MVSIYKNKSEGLGVYLFDPTKGPTEPLVSAGFG